jgi:CubicO group peptidase (beta-lactamase class C family)
MVPPVIGFCKKTMQSVRNDEAMNVRKLSKMLAEIPLAFDPGTQWRYGFSHDVLGALIEVLSGMTFGRFLKKEIFDPLSMQDTYFKNFVHSSISSTIVLL